MKLSINQFGILFLLALQINAALLPNSNKDFRFLRGELFKNFSLTAEDIKTSIDFAYTITNHLKRLEDNIQWKVNIKRGSPNHGLFISYRPDEKAIVRGREALIASKATLQLINKLCADFHVDYHKCRAQIKLISFNETPLRSICSHLEKTCTPEEYHYPYRSPDGSCNHISRGSLGEAFTGFSRVLPAEYSDEVFIPRRAHSKIPLPNARRISNYLVENIQYPNQEVTMAVLAWAQFLEHDLSRFASSTMIHFNQSIDCCDRNGFNLSPRHIHPFCYAIPIPWDDHFYSEHGIHCMSYVKSLPAIQPDCSLGPNDQINQATHFLDGSQIYGNSFEKSSKLRMYVDGKLAVTRSPYGEYLPLSTNATEYCQVESNESPCFISGDPRVNFLPHLTVMHTLWMREHNRIAAELALLNGYWDDETIFQESRRIVIAEIQHITYNEWLSKVLDYNHFLKIHNEVYDEESDPRVSNSFASAALRAFMSMISENISLVNETRHSFSFLNPREHFNNPEIILMPRVFDSLLRGLATQKAENVDMHYTEDLTNQFSANGPYGYDVLSLDIQRSRDHGLPSYNNFRRFCGLEKATSFAEFEDHITPKNLHALSKVYSHPNDVDLIVGGLMEEPEPGFLLGPTFSCLIGDQLLRSKIGDRYFYSNQEQPRPFSDAQLREIQKITLARIFCDNSNEIKELQPNVFERISEGNHLVRCDGVHIPRLSLMPWLDNKERYYSK